MSYVRVIERLEKQGERKRELRQQKAEQRAAKAAAKAAQEAKQAKTEKETEPSNKKNPQETSSDSNSQQADQEIEKIIDQAKTSKDTSDKATDKISANNLSAAATTTATTAAASSSSSSEKVKSPDFSFVDVSVRPRQTLNLLQRNLSSPTYSMQTIEINNRLDTTVSESSELQQQVSPQVFQSAVTVNSQQQTTLFNPKKRWLKCSEATSTAAAGSTEAMISPTGGGDSGFSPTLGACASSGFAQPPKKRRHMFGGEEQENSVDVDYNNNETSNGKCF